MMFDEDAFMMQQLFPSETYAQKRARMSTGDMISKDQNQVLKEYRNVFEALDDRMSKFFAQYGGDTSSSSSSSSPNGTFPAIDIGAGRGIYATTMALHWRAPHFDGELEWYATNFAGQKGHKKFGEPLNEETIEALTWQLREEQELEEEEEKVEAGGADASAGHESGGKTEDASAAAPSGERPATALFLDGNGNWVFRREPVILNGLKTKYYNGHEGLIKGRDPTTAGRYAVELGHDDTYFPSIVKSFKGENISYDDAEGKKYPHLSSLRRLRLEGKSIAFFQGMVDRIREVDIVQPETWDNVQDLRGRCAVITATHLLSQIGYRIPTAWKDTLVFADQFLHPGGHLLQFDNSCAADFADVPLMKAYVEEKSLGLKLVEHRSPDEMMFTGGRGRDILVWQKESA